MDLSRLSDKDIDALAKGDVGSLSTEGLNLILGVTEEPITEVPRVPKKSTLTGEVVRGAKQLGSDVLTGVQALVGSPEEAAKAALARGERISEEAGEGPSFARLRRTYEEKGVLPAIGQAVSDIPQAIAAQVPQLAAMAGAAKLGAMAGTAVAPGPGTIAGGIVGAGASLLPQFFGANIARQAEEQKARDEQIAIDRGAAATAAAGQAALEAAGTAFVFGKRIVKGVLGVTDDAAIATDAARRRLTQQAQRSLAAAAGRGAARGVATEMPVEIAQSVLERAQAGLDVTSEDALKEYGESAYLAGLVGGPLGGIGGVSRRAGARQQLAAEPPPEAAAPPGEVAIMPPKPDVAITPPPAEPPPAEPPVAEAPPPVAETPPAPPVVTPPVAETPPAEEPKPPQMELIPPPKEEAFDPNYETGLPEDAPKFLADIQDRNRATPASIAQMNSVASAPDYDRLRVSPFFGQGAPVVMSDLRLSEAQFGRTDTATAENGRKIPVRYAVVEADSLLPSNTFDGRPVEKYADPEFYALRAVAGNGRIAGLQEAYNRGTNKLYTEALKKDTSHGVAPAVIEQMRKPVLVRLMPKSYVTADIGDVSNVQPGLGKNPVEMAKADVKRIDIGGLEFNDDGSFSDKTLRQFIQGMPESERGALLDTKGRPNPVAVDRLNNAVFQSAYGNDALIELYANATNPEAKLVLAALAKSASKMSKLKDAGEYDVRNTVVQAAEQAVNAARQGVPLAQFAEQRGLGVDENTYAVMKMIGANNRSAKRISDYLNQLADSAYAESQRKEDMFGGAPKRPVNDLFKGLGAEEPDLFTQPKPAAEDKTFQINKTPQQIDQDLAGASTRDALNYLVDNAPNSVAKYIAEKLRTRVQGMIDNGINVEFKINRGREVDRSYKGVAVTYPPPDVKVVVKLNEAAAPEGSVGTTYRTLMHEFLHAATVPQAWIFGKLTKKFYPQRYNVGKESEYARELTTLLNQVRNQLRKDIANRVDHPIVKRGYERAKGRELENIMELVAYGLTEPDFQDYLSRIKVGPKQTAFSKLAELFRKLLNIDAKYETALERIARVTETAVEVPMAELAPKLKRALLPGATAEKQTAAPLETTAKPAEVIKEKLGQALQKRRAPVGGMQGIDPDLVEQAKKFFFPEKKTIVDKIESMKDRFWQRVAQGLVDQFRTIKQYSETGYIFARLSKAIDGALEGLILHGQVFNDGGALNIRKNTQGLVEIMKPLGEEVSRFQMWLALNREANMPAEKRSFLGSPEWDNLIANRQEWSDGELNGRPRIEVYNEVREKLNGLNRSVLNVAREMGLIDSSEYEIDRINEGRAPSPLDRKILSAPIQERITELKKEIRKTPKDERPAYMMDELKDLRAQLKKIREAKDWTISERKELVDYYVNNPGAYERFASDIYYIPFYREMEDGDVSAIRTAAGLSNQKFSKELKGGESPFADMTENVLRNWSHILSASLKNQAAVRTVQDAASPDFNGTAPNLKTQYYMVDGVVYNRSNDEIAGDGTVQPWMTSSEGKDLAKIMVNGQEMYYKVLDPLLLESIMSVGYLGPKSKFLDMARTMKNWLQFGVTISPVFRTNNLIRDSVSALAISDLKKSPIQNVLTGMASARKGDENYIAALSGGGIFQFGSVVEGDQADLVKRLIERGIPRDTILDTPDRVKAAMRKAWDKYQEFGNQAEAANRLALYKQLRDGGMSHLEATYRARDLLDFSMQGAWGSWRILTQTVPFLNARAQGLYKLGRDGILPTTRVFYNSITGKPLDQTDKQKANSFFYVTSAVTMASLALYLAFQDDEEFQQRDAWDRDNFWWFKLPGMEYALRVPKPFEIGAIATLAERTLEQIIDQGAEGKQFKDTLSRMLFDTFAFNLPQAFKPLVDLYSNKDSFTGAPIESAGMERLSKAERATDNTSALAKLLGGVANLVLPEKAEVSPVQMDYAIKAYFGWLGGTAAWASNYAVAPFRDGEYPDQKWVDKVSLGYLRQLPSTQSRYVQSFYEYNRKFNQSLADMRHYAEVGQADKVMEILEKKGDEIGMAKFYDKTSDNMAKIRRQIRVVTNDPNMTGAEKTEAIDRMKLLISELAKQAEEARKMMKQ